jgi:translation elongation factor EF-G
MTGGRASHVMNFSHYEVLPHELVEKIIEEAQAAKAE